MRIEVEATPLADRIDGATYDRILADCRDALGRFVTGDGRAGIPIVGHIVTARAATAS